MRDMAVDGGVRHIRSITRTTHSRRGGTMRITMTLTGVLALAAVAPLAAQTAAGERIRRQRSRPRRCRRAGRMRLDDKDATKSAKFETMGPGFHVTSGGAGIYWRAADAQKDNYTVSANFRQAVKNTGHGEHGEAFGLFVAGRDLNDAAKETYLYFLVRQDGMFMISHRAGPIGAQPRPTGPPTRRFTSSTTCRTPRTISRSRWRRTRCASS